MQWTVFCRVIDNLGDVGVCWRLARELARRGQTVRLVIDDPQALAWMAPGGAQGAFSCLSVHAWSDALLPGDVVLEAFGCDPPAAFVRQMSAQTRAPVWINLEHLSAEAYVERSHGLPSPQPGGLTKWFFFPGFNPRTGGLLREADLLRRRAAFKRCDWLAAHGWAAQPGERVVSLFCYANAALTQLLDHLSHWASAPTLLLLTPDAAQQVQQLEVSRAGTGRLRWQVLPWLSQDTFDELLWACDINFVRGEDSLVRAIWAGAPWVWQAYPQDDGAHHAKVEALLQAQRASPAVAAFWRAWNGMGSGAASCLPALPDSGPWQHECTAWRAQLASQASLADALLAFVHNQQIEKESAC